MTDRPGRWYRGAGWSARAHVALRWATAPFGPVADAVGDRARVLDWGCGHGVGALHLAARSIDRTVVGTDIDGAKLAIAGRAAAASPAAGRVSFEQVPPEALPEGRWDAVVIDDVLYLLEPEAQARVIRAAAGALEPDGVVVAKVMGRAPRWKAWLNRRQERLAVEVARITASAGGVHGDVEPTEVAAWLAAAGLEVEVRAADRGYHVPHVLVIGHRPRGGADGRLHP